LAAVTIETNSGLHQWICYEVNLYISIVCVCTSFTWRE